MKTGLESLDTGAPNITYSGNEGPQAPQQMAMADPFLVEEYQKYVFEMEEQGLQPMSFEEFRLQAMSGMAEGGIANPRLVPHTGADLLVKKNPDGTRPKYQPPGGGATSLGSGRDYSSRDTGSDYGQFDRAVSRAANNPPSSAAPSIGYGEGKVDPGLAAAVGIGPAASGFVGTTTVGGGKGGDETFIKKIKEPILGPISFLVNKAGKASMVPFLKYRKKAHLKTLGTTDPNVYEEDETYQAIVNALNLAEEGQLSNKDFQNFMPGNIYGKTLLDFGPEGGDGPQPIVYPYPTSTAVAPTAVAPEATAVATAPANPFLQGGNLPFSTYGTVPHGAQFGVDQRMFAADGGRIGYAGGGITDLRQGYFLGKLVKKATRGIKKIIKSPIGKAALLYGLGSMGGSYGLTGKLFSQGMFNPRNIKAGLFGANNLMKGYENVSTAKMGGLFEKLGLTKGYGSLMPTAMGGMFGLSTLPLIFGQSKEDEEGVNYADLSNIFDKYSPDQLRQMALTGGVDRAQYPFLPATAYAADGGRIGLMNGGDLRAAALNQLYGINDDEDKKFSQGGSAGLPPITAGVETQASQSFSDDETPMPTQPDQMPRPRPMPNPMMMAGRMNPMMMAGRMNPMMARGMMPRMMAQEGGLMDMGGMEKDYRNEGGFVPIGGQERADDVPARLSKNEFVFTADAVRNAGGGDIDKGAEVMENMMENLEKGGKVSEESQGLKGARDMFATAQRLEGVL